MLVLDLWWRCIFYVRGRACIWRGGEWEYETSLIQKRSLNLVPIAVGSASSASRGDVERASFYTEYPNIRAIVRAIGFEGNRGKFNYAAPTSVLRLRISVSYVSGRDKDYDDTIAALLPIVMAGDTIVVHCENSFHRGPLAASCLFWCFAGVDPQDR